MGMAPSADLYWGFNLGDMTHPTTWESLKPPWMGGYERLWEEVYAERAHGWIETPFPENLCPDQSAIYSKYYGDYNKAHDEIQVAENAFRDTPEYQAWSANRTELQGHAAKSSVNLDTYGCIHDPCYFIYVFASHQRADDYGDIALKPLVVGDDWKTQLLDFMKLMEIPIPEGEEPGWHMNCSYS